MRDTSPADMAELLASGIDVDAKNANGDYLITLACQCLCADIVRLLIDSHANINCQNSNGDTPLICTIDYAQHNPETAYQIVKILLDNGADVNKKTSDGLTSLDIAVLNNQLAIIKMLLSQGGALSGQVATELKKLGCQSNLDPTTNLYDTTFDDLLPVLKKIQSTLDNQ